jgi:hypothetical protein
VTFLIWARDFFCLSIYIALILALIKCFLCIIVKTTILVNNIGRIRSTQANNKVKLLFLSLSFKSVGKLYYILSLSLVYLLKCLLLDELEEKRALISYLISQESSYNY